MKASIVIPVYNGQRFIAQTIASALDQTLEDCEVIVVNDGSGDDSECETLAFEREIVYIPQANRGVSAARNAGVMRARGEYIAFLDQDDLCRANKLERLAGYLDAHPECGMVYSSLGRIDEHGGVYPEKKVPTWSGDIFVRVFMRSYIAPSMIMCRRETLLEVGLFQERYSSRGEDYDLVLRLAMHTPVGMVDEELGQYRLHADNTSKKVQEIAPFIAEELLNQYKDYLLEHYRLGWLHYRRRMAKIYREQARVCRVTGRVTEARRLYRTAFRCDPSRLDVLREMFAAHRR